MKRYKSLNPCCSGMSIMVLPDEVGQEIKELYLPLNELWKNEHNLKVTITK